MIPETLADLAVAVDTLVPYGANPRRGDVSKIAESLSVNGQYRPIVVREQTREVLAGNHTLAAAKSLGWDSIAATFVSCDDEQAKRIVLVDNRSNDVAGYDNAELLDLLRSLEEGLEGTGFDAGSLAELERLVREAEVPPEPLTDPDYVPPSPRVPVSEPGDVWELGVHRLVVGDGTDPEVVAKAMGGALADAYISDPPYNVAYQGGTADALQIENDDMGADEFRSFLGALFCAAYAHTRAGAPVYIFHADTEGVAFRQSLVDAGWLLKQVLVWVKNSLVLGRQDHHWQHEPILYGWKPGAGHSWYGGRKLTTVIDDQLDLDLLSRDEIQEILAALLAESTVIRADKPARNAEHPTMKPVALIAQLLSRSTRIGDLVLDTCAGSGSLLIACHGLSRRAALTELDPRYADVICRRFQEHTGTLPRRDGVEHDFTR